MERLFHYRPALRQLVLVKCALSLYVRMPYFKQVKETVVKQLVIAFLAWNYMRFKIVIPILTYLFLNFYAFFLKLGILNSLF